MTLETMIGSLTHDDKLLAMDLLWRDLTREAAGYVSPEWHGRVIADRLANPDPIPALPLDEAMAEVKERLHARRTQS